MQKPITGERSYELISGWDTDRPSQDMIEKQAKKIPSGVKWVEE